MNIAWWLERAADEYGCNVALVDGRRGTSWTYAELRDRAEAVAAVVRDEIGVGRDDVVVTLMPDDLWHNAVFWGVNRFGAVFSGFNRTLTFDKFATDAERLRAKVVCVTWRPDMAGMSRKRRSSERRRACGTTSRDRRAVQAHGRITNLPRVWRSSSSR